MSRNSLLWPLLCLGAVACAGAAPATCPSSLSDGGTRHALDNASLYDGPPDQMADLVPVSAGDMDRWNLDGVDPYLVCKYSGTTKVVTFHAVGAKLCEGGGKPLRAYCRR